MKKILALIVILSLCIPSHTQSRKERKAEKLAQLKTSFLETKALIESGKFMFEARWANPLGNDVANIGLSLPGGAAVFQGNRVDVSTNTNFVKLNNDDIDLFLPFFGRVFFPKRLNNSGGFVYKGKIENHSIDVNEKKRLLVMKFEAKTQDDFLKFHFRIGAGGNTILTVNSTNRQTIFYDGSIVPLEN